MPIGQLFLGIPMILLPGGNAGIMKVIPKKNNGFTIISGVYGAKENPQVDENPYSLVCSVARCDIGKQGNRF